MLFEIVMKNYNNSHEKLSQIWEKGPNLYSALPFAGRRVLTFRDYREPRIANNTGEIIRT
jgi:hypothetical protein